MRPSNLKDRLFLLLAISCLGLVFTPCSPAQVPAEEHKGAAAALSPEGTRIIISTSGPAKFNSYWLDSPPRLTVEFQSGNIVSNLGPEIKVEQGVIKKITADYFDGAEKRSLKALTFELTQKVPYKIWQETDTLVLDFQTPQGISVFPEDGREIFASGPKAADAIAKQSRPAVPVLTEAVENHPELNGPKAMDAPAGKEKKNKGGPLFWLISIVLIPAAGVLLFWLLRRRYKLILDNDAAGKEIEKLRTQLQEQNQLLEHERIIRRTVESTSLQREKEFDRVKMQFQRERQLLEQERNARKAAEERLSYKEKEVAEAKGSLENLKEVLVEKGAAKKLAVDEKGAGLWISGRSAEKRECPRLDLSKDYNRTIILRIGSGDKSKSVKSFANNIGLGGVCFETRREFNRHETLNVRLFFFGDKVPMMRAQAKVSWSKIDTPVNRYGISFTGLEEKDKAALDRYIETKMAA